MNNVLHEPRCEALGSTLAKAVGDITSKPKRITDLNNMFIDLANRMLNENKATPVEVYYSLSTTIANILGTWYANCRNYERFLKEKTGTDCADMIIVFIKILGYLVRIQLYGLIEEELGGPRAEDIMIREASFEACDSFIEDAMQKTFASR